MDHLIQAKSPELMLIKKKKRTCQVGFVILCARIFAGLPSFATFFN